MKFPCKALLATFVPLLTSVAFATEDVPEIRFSNERETVGVTHSDRPQDINFKEQRGFRNDEARSVSLINVRVGALIYVFDSPNAATNDDWTLIRVKRMTWRGLRISSFERSYENADVQVVYHRKNGLDGKVSHCRIR